MSSVFAAVSDFSPVFWLNLKSNIADSTGNFTPMNIGVGPTCGGSHCSFSGAVGVNISTSLSYYGTNVAMGCWMYDNVFDDGMIIGQVQLGSFSVGNSMYISGVNNGFRILTDAVGTTTQNLALPSTSAWHLYVWKYSGGTLQVWQDTSPTNNTAPDGNITANFPAITIGESGSAFGVVANITNCFMLAGTGNTFDQGEINELYSAGPTASYTTFFAGSTVTSNLTVAANDAYNSSIVFAYNVTISNSTTTLTEESNRSNGLTIFGNVSSGLYNISISSLLHNGGYMNITYSSWNASIVLNASLTRLFNLSEPAYTNTIVYSGTEYARNLSIQVNVTCGALGITKLLGYVNNSLVSTNTLNCNNGNLSINTSYVHSLEGNFSIFYRMNTSYLPEYNNMSTATRQFLSDLNAPNVTLNISLPGSWNATTFNASLRCDDTIMPVLNYSLFANGNSLFNGSKTTGSTQYNITNTVDGNNELQGVCTDLFSSTSRNQSFAVTLKQFILINELTGGLFNLSAESVKLYYDDNHSYFDFKVQNRSYANLSLLDTPHLRLQIEYANGDIITRYLDLAQINGSNVRICANPEGTQHYEQIITSAQERFAYVTNVFADCLIAADNTNFAYQDTFILKAYTIASVYYLYTHIDGLQTFLASVDGSTATYINLDNIIFNLQGLDLSISSDGFSFQKTNTNELTLYYNNPVNDNNNMTLTITREDNHSVVFTTSTFTNPNTFSVVFDYYTLYNITNTTIFKVTAVIGKDSGTTVTKTFYMNPNGKVGSFPSAPAFVVVLILLVFGLTWTASSITFGWFGLFVELGCLLILFLAQSAWYIDFMKAIVMVLIAFTGVLFLSKYKYTVVG